MTGQAIIARLKELHDIPEADKIQQAKIYGETIIVSKDHEEGELGILFDMETQLSHDFCHYNNLYRHSHLNADTQKQGYIEDNRRVKPLRLKGVQCSGFWMPISSLSYIDRCFGYDSSKETGANSLEEGYQFTEIDGEEICKKWIPSRRRTSGSGKRKKEGRISFDFLIENFKEHVDTDHWARNKHQVEEGNLVILTEKLHGTSGRASYASIKVPMNIFKKIILWVNSMIIHKMKLKLNEATASRMDFVVGSRRTIKSIGGTEKENAKHYYESDLWTKAAKEHFEGKLYRGETVYFEIVGYTPEGQPIMGIYSNEKLKPFMDKKEYKEFIDRYGKETVFTYGCVSTAPIKATSGITGDITEHFAKYKVFVYRITQTNKNDVTIDLSWEQVKRRCDQMNVPHVPELKKYYIEEENNIITRILDQEVDTFAHLPSKNFPEHLREGVVVRIEHGGLIPKFLKHKNYYYRVLEGQIKEPTLEDEN